MTADSLNRFLVVALLSGLTTVPANAFNSSHLSQVKTVQNCTACDLSEADLRGISLTSAVLKSSNLEAANLSRADLNGANLRAFLRASIKGWREAAANPKEAVDIVMKIAPTLNRAQQESMLTEAYKLMTAGKAKTEGLFFIDPPAINSAQDFLLANKVLSKPIDTTLAFDASFLKSLTPAERKP